MQKKILALAIAGLSTAAFAQSNVTIYGLVNPSYDFVTIKEADGTKNRVVNVNDNSSRIGFKGEEALGNGLKAIFQMEAYFNVTDKTGFDGARDAFVGLSGGFGTATIGARDGVYKRITSSYDAFGDSLNDYNSIMGVSYDAANIDNNSRYAKAVDYISPNFGGVQVMGSYALKSERLSGSTIQNNTRYDIGATYENAGLGLLAAYSRVNSEGDPQAKWFKVGASYKFATGTKLSGIYEKLKSDEAYDQKHYFIGVEHPIGNIDLLANYIKASDDKVAAGDNGAKAYNLGVRYNLSKRTNVLGMYTNIKNDAEGQFGSDAGYVGGAGSKIDAVSVRLQHKF